MCRPPSSACGLPYQASGRRSRRAARLLFDRCATSPETRPLLAVSLTHPSRVQRCPMGWEAVIPRPVIRGPMAVVFPRSCSPVPPRAVLGVPLPTMLIVRRRRWGPVIGRERRRFRPVIAPPPASRPRRRSNSDHARKSSYSGEIDYRFLTFQIGSRI